MSRRFDDSKSAVVRRFFVDKVVDDVAAGGDIVVGTIAGAGLKDSFTGSAYVILELESLTSQSFPQFSKSVVSPCGLFILFATSWLRMYSKSSAQNPPLPGSSAGLGTFLKHLFRDRLCLIEFCQAASADL